MPLYAGLTPTAIGLYQFNVVVPNGLATGDLPAVIGVGGQTSNVFSIPVQSVSGVQSELIQNGGFENPLTQWFIALNSGDGAAATLDRSTTVVHDGNYSAHISFTAAGTVGDVNFFQRGFPIVQGTTYILQFWATSSNARTLQLGIQEGSGNFQSYGLASTLPVGPGWQLYRIPFQATATASDGQISFFFGNQTEDTWLDSVSLMAVISATGQSN
jgi:hypothetical protein